MLFRGVLLGVRPGSIPLWHFLDAVEGKQHEAFWAANAWPFLWSARQQALIACQTAPKQRRESTREREQVGELG